MCWTCVLKKETNWKWNNLYNLKEKTLKSNILKFPKILEESLRAVMKFLI